MHGRTYARHLSGRFLFIALAAIAALVIAPGRLPGGHRPCRGRRSQRRRGRSRSRAQQPELRDAERGQHPLPDRHLQLGLEDRGVAERHLLDHQRRRRADRRRPLDPGQVGDDLEQQRHLLRLVLDARHRRRDRQGRSRTPTPTSTTPRTSPTPSCIPRSTRTTTSTTGSATSSSASTAATRRRRRPTPTSRSRRRRTPLRRRPARRSPTRSRSRTTARPRHMTSSSATCCPRA